MGSLKLLMHQFKLNQNYLNWRKAQTFPNRTLAIQMRILNPAKAVKANSLKKAASQIIDLCVSILNTSNFLLFISIIIRFHHLSRNYQHFFSIKTLNSLTTHTIEPSE
jgi:hypothetical protein